MIHDDISFVFDCLIWKSSLSVIVQFVGRIVNVLKKYAEIYKVLGSILYTGTKITNLTFLICLLEEPPWITRES